MQPCVIQSYVSLTNPKPWTIPIVLVVLATGGFYATGFVVAYGYGEFHDSIVTVHQVK